MDREPRNPFHGLVDSISEWNRIGGWVRAGSAPTPGTRLSGGDAGDKHAHVRAQAIQVLQKKLVMSMYSQPR
jgi:hypothetical protein